MDICGKDPLWIPEGNCECPEGGGPAIQDVMHSQLVSLRNAGLLEPGTQYRIIDYECTTTQEGTSVVQHPFDIIVFADDESTLNENARAVIRDGDTYYSSNNAHPNAWELKYTIDNDTDRFAWVDPVNGKGVVYYMKDEYGNEVPYDFKQIVFERYEILDDLSEITELDIEHGFISMGAAQGGDDPGPKGPAVKAPAKAPTKAANGQTVGQFILSYEPVYAYTFSDLDALSGVISDGSVTQGIHFNAVHNNIIGPSYYEARLSTHILPDNVFINGTDDPTDSLYENNVIGRGGKGNTFGYGFSKNILGDACTYITAAGSCLSNQIGNDAISIFLGSICHENHIGEKAQGIYLSQLSMQNTFGAVCRDVITGTNAACNIVGPSCGVITLLGNYNTLEGTNTDIYIQGMANRVGRQCSTLTIKGSSNSFVLSCSYILLDDRCDDNSFGTYCHDINCGYSTQDCTFENNVHDIYLDGNYFHTMTFETGVSFVTLSNPSPNGVGHYYFTTGTSGTLQNPLSIAADLQPYTRYVALRTDGTLRIWNPADQT